MKRNFTWTIVSCLAVMLIALSLYVNKMTTKVYLSNEQLKDLGLYLIGKWDIDLFTRIAWRRTFRGP